MSDFNTEREALVEAAAEAMWLLFMASLPRPERFSRISWAELEEVNRQAWRDWVIGASS